ncbi:cytochrome P450 family protein [Nocardiopsis kunsanensis]|uniref:Uncharacterized protein n=1 Tax=Nocardiopsis kunsanensis TaxID=141693 RepID=A0A918XAF4_9ACTN|nr:cytochrome P450 [Nocardiopsis kunsanensis]GHD19840.1 hypothetical protein GCM10007147_11130 [Nocardiopsis kunsanensis]
MDLLDGLRVDARLRKVARPAFVPRMVRRDRELVEQALARGGFDLVRVPARPLPVRGVAHLLGIPESDHVRSVRSGTTIGAVLAWSARHPGRIRHAGAELDVLFDRLFAERRTLPREDVLSCLAPAAVEEALRYGSSAQTTGRWAHRDTEGAGEHLSFSPCARYCSGAPPARSEGGAALQVPAEQAPGSVPVAAPRRRRMLTVRGLSDLPVKVGVC